MPSPFYSTDATYGLRALLGTSTINDVDLGFAALRDDVASKMKGAIPRVAALPTVGPSGSGPLVDGQEIYFVADSANGVIWHLRYNAASGSAYKWEFIGGAELFAEVTAFETTASGAFTDLATVGPSITVPLAGDYSVSIGMDVSGTQGGIMSYAIGATAASAADQIDVFDGSGVTQQASVYRTRRKTGLAITTALVAKYRSPGGTSGGMQNRQMVVRPVRVG